MLGLPAYFLGKQGVRDAMFLPEVIKVRIQIDIPDFKRQSLKDTFHNLVFVLTK
jgi:hypothetical protein